VADHGPAPKEQDWLDRVKRLEAEVAGLRRSLRTRGLIEQAKGRLAERLGLDPEEAFRQIAERSQRTNVSVVDIAADILGALDDQPDVDPTLRRVVRVQVRVAAAAEPAELLTSLGDEVDIASAALFAVEADGALRLMAERGWPAGLASDWRWLPSGVRTPASEAVIRSEPVWLDHPSGLTVLGPGPHRAAIPLMAGPAAIGVLEAGLSGPISPQTRRQLLAAAEAMAAWLASAETAPAPDPENDRWLEATVDATLTPAAILRPQWSDGEIRDFEIDYANPAAMGEWSKDCVGRRLLDVEPGLLHDGAFDTYVAAYLQRGLGEGGRRQAARIGSRLMATWLPYRDGDALDSTFRVTTMEEAGAFGWGEWTQALEPIVCSPGLLRLLGRSASRGAVAFDRLLAAVLPEDRAQAESAARSVLRDARPLTVDLRVRASEQTVRWLRMVAAPRLDHQGRPRALIALFQDRTDANQREQAATKVAERLATQRVQSAVERAQTEQLRAAFFPPSWTRRPIGNLLVLARHVAPGAMRRFRGDFYEVNQSSSGVVVAVGDVFGSGVVAAHTMVRIRYSTRALTLAGLGPADVVRLTNQEFCADADPPLASLILAEVDQAGGAVSWAHAGHYSPILVRQGRARSLRRPRGDVLGLLGDAVYTQSTVRLQPADMLVLFTDGVFQRWGPEGLRRLGAECEWAYANGGAEALMERVLPPAEDEACLVAIEVRPRSDP
jgi:PAS domain-containing protein